ncbi:MAG: hypothetical protein NTW21_03050 [Verrucomicrobia bacterium]|nr:hypothetical protein [Verrucomicrobiota bacterium]
MGTRHQRIGLLRDGQTAIPQARDRYISAILGHALASTVIDRRYISAILSHALASTVIDRRYISTILGHALASTVIDRRYISAILGHALASTVIDRRYISAILSHALASFPQLHSLSHCANERGGVQLSVKLIEARRAG